MCLIPYEKEYDICFDGLFIPMYNEVIVDNFIIVDGKVVEDDYKIPFTINALMNHYGIEITDKDEFKSQMLDLFKTMHESELIKPKR